MWFTQKPRYLRYAAQRLEAPGAKTLRLKSGEETLQYLFAVGEFAHYCPGMPGLMLIDVALPVMSGPCLLDIVRAHPLTHSIPIVMLGCDGDSRELRRCDRFAADAYLVQPLDLERDCARIANIVARCVPQLVRASGLSSSHEPAAQSRRPLPQQRLFVRAV
jgi:CheY-like chemotaxis protein